jgi:hypothetical protein
MSSRRALVPYPRAGSPAVDDACAAGRAVATGTAFVCGASRANAVQGGEKQRDQTGSHCLAHWLAFLSLQASLNPLPAITDFLDRLLHGSF